MRSVLLDFHFFSMNIIRIMTRRTSERSSPCKKQQRRTRNHTMSAPTTDAAVANGYNDKDHDDDEDEDDEDDCFDDGEGAVSGRSLSSSTRKRTYTYSSANSDPDIPAHVGSTNGGGGGPILGRRRSHKRGRQKKRAKLSFRQEFADLEGINDIKYGVYMVHDRETDLLDPKVEPKSLDFLSLIWAKCKGYPSYPALVSFTASLLLICLLMLCFF